MGRAGWCCAIQRGSDRMRLLFPAFCPQPGADGRVPERFQQPPRRSGPARRRRRCTYSGAGGGGGGGPPLPLPGACRPPGSGARGRRGGGGAGQQRVKRGRADLGAGGDLLSLQRLAGGRQRLQPGRRHGQQRGRGLARGRGQPARGRRRRRLERRPPPWPWPAGAPPRPWPRRGAGARGLQRPCPLGDWGGPYAPAPEGCRWR
mmetsp:Transcript_7866/g.12421  ORF Transcript_7866/g.12421 Transcript_7866/m.12421 type:complete len:204 (-) Transcript_7866:751-1362(-)